MSTDYLQRSAVVDWDFPAVLALARSLAAPNGDPIETIRNCFTWVRDEVRHSRDFGLTEVPCRASDVLAARSGYCYAKSHLLAALLRANGIPAAFAYQRLSRDGGGPPFCLHGLNAVLLPEIGWFRLDARGNRHDVHAEFEPPVEKLAFPTLLPEESDVPGIFAEPLPNVVETLLRCKTAQEVWENLPDLR